MPSCGILLITLLAASAAAAAAQGTQGRSFYSKVASCVAQEARKEAINAAGNAVGIAQADGSSRAPDSVDYYAVAFTPGIGCFLMSVITSAPEADPNAPLNATPRYTPGVWRQQLCSLNPTL
jgi:hypothetical protein